MAIVIIGPCLREELTVLAEKLGATFHRGTLGAARAMRRTLEPEAIDLLEVEEIIADGVPLTPGGLADAKRWFLALVALAIGEGRGLSESDQLFFNQFGRAFVHRISHMTQEHFDELERLCRDDRRRVEKRN